MKTGCVSIVIPIYNEEANLPELLRRCLEMGRTLDRAFEIVLVDDGSKDGSRQMLAAAAGGIPPTSSPCCSTATTGSMRP